MNSGKEKLLLHTCCAPCSVYVINQLLDNYNVTVIFNNPNIFPEDEYLLRLSEVRNYCRKRNIDYVENEFAPDKWFDFIKGYENEPETGFRCDLCFLYRLSETASFAKNNNFDCFTTTLTIGRQKNSKKIIDLGLKIQDKYGVRFLEYDFKKKNGTQIADWLSNQMGLYKQNYCGCVFSKNDKLHE